VSPGLSILLATASAHACDEAEYRRLSGEQTRLAQRSAWSGVERAYERLERTRCALSVDQHQLAAEAARGLGKTWEQYARLERALAVSDDAAIRSQLDAIAQSFGRVSVRGDPRRPPELVREVLPFAPDQQRSIEWARTVLAETGRFDGLLPVGEYVVGGEPLEVEAGVGEPRRLALSRRGASDREGRGPLRYLAPVGHLGPTWLFAPDNDVVTTLSDGGHQLSPATVSVFGIGLGAGVEAGFSWGEPALGVAVGVDYAGGYGLDTLHAVGAWSLFVVRPGDARFAIGPQYRLLFGSGTGVAEWFDRGQDPSSQPRSDIRYAGWAFGGGLQAWAGYAPLTLEPLQGVVEIGGSWHSDGARSYLTLGLRVGIVPHIERFDG